MTQNQAPTPARSLWRRGALAAVLSALVNALLFGAAVAADVFRYFGLPPGAERDVFVGPVVLLSVVGALAGTAVYAAIRKRAARPERTFLAVAAVVLVLSFVGPFLMPGTSLGQALVLNLMHAVVAAFTVGLLLRR